MAEYIERSEAIEFTKQNTPNINGETTIQCVERSLLNVPTADVVEVVRCKNCKYFDIEEDDALGTCMGKFICISSGGEIYPEPNHYCSYKAVRMMNGERLLEKLMLTVTTKA